MQTVILRDDQGSESPVKTGALAMQDRDSPTGLTIRVGAGRPGGSAQAQFDRLHIEREKRLEASWGRYLAPIVKRLSDDPQSTRAWASGAWGEEWVGGNLERLLGAKALLLHDRRVPRTRGNIDHIAVASSGVWVIDAKNYDGRVELRDVGGWFRVDKRLYLGGWDRTKLIDGLDWQVAAVEACVADLEVPVRPSSASSRVGDAGRSRSRSTARSSLGQPSSPTGSPNRARSIPSRSTSGDSPRPCTPGQVSGFDFNRVWLPGRE